MKNPFSNLFKKKQNNQGDAPVPQKEEKRKKKVFLVNFLKTD